MFRKIICPTDLSPAAQNAVSYAAKLCQLTGASLELLHTEPVFAHELLLDGRRKEHDAVAMSEELRKVAYEVSKLFNITCSHHVELSNLPLEEAISAQADEETLVVVGTNGADTLFQRIFGSNAFNIAKQAFTQVLVVPEGVSYGTIRTIAFAWDYDVSKPLIRQVKDFSDQLGSRLVFLHISTHATEISKDVFNALSDRVSEVIGERSLIEYRRMYGSDIRESLDHYMKDRQADLLAISMKNGRMVRKAFRNESGVGSLPAYPLLITHSHRHPGDFH